MASKSLNGILLAQEKFRSPLTRLASSAWTSASLRSPASRNAEQIVTLYAAVSMRLLISEVRTGTEALVQLFHIHVQIGADRRREDVEEVIDVPETVKLWKITAGRSPSIVGERFSPCTVTVPPEI